MRIPFDSVWRFSAPARCGFLLPVWNSIVLYWQYGDALLRELGHEPVHGLGPLVRWRVDLWVLHKKKEKIMRKEHASSKNDAAILIVEDNPMARRSLENILTKLGEKADIAVDGEEAIEKSKIHRYRLILMDIELPGKNGCEATEIIRHWEKTHKLQPAYIVAQSSNMDKKMEKQSLAVGMNVCRSKPLTAGIIQELLNTIMKNENSMLLG